MEIIIIIKTKLITVTFIKRFLVAKGKTKVIILGIAILSSIGKELTSLLNKVNLNIIYKNKSEIAV